MAVRLRHLRSDLPERQVQWTDSFFRKTAEGRKGGG